MEMRQQANKIAKSEIGLSRLAIVIVSLFAALLIAVSALLLQWIIYDDWLRSSHPLHYVGTTLAAVLAFVLVYRSQMLFRERQRETLHRFEVVARMNDRIRNALQIIDCTAFASQPQAADQVRHAVDVIDGVLREVLVNVGGAPEPLPARKPATSSLGPEATSAKN